MSWHKLFQKNDSIIIFDPMNHNEPFRTGTFDSIQEQDYARVVVDGRSIPYVNLAFIYPNKPVIAQLLQGWLAEQKRLKKILDDHFSSIYNIHNQIYRKEI